MADCLQAGIPKPHDVGRRRICARRVGIVSWEHGREGVGAMKIQSNPVLVETAEDKALIAKLLATFNAAGIRVQLQPDIGGRYMALVVENRVAVSAETGETRRAALEALAVKVAIKRLT